MKYSLIKLIALIIYLIVMLQNVHIKAGFEGRITVFCNKKNTNYYLLSTDLRYIVKNTIQKS